MENSQYEVLPEPFSSCANSSARLPLTRGFSSSNVFDFHKDLTVAKKLTGWKAVFNYFVFALTRELIIPLSTVLMSAGGALLMFHKFGIAARISYQPFNPMQVVLGFLTGFYLNHAFDRNSGALESTRSMSIRLRSFAHVSLGFIFDNYIRIHAKDLDREFKHKAVEDATEIIALCKYYYICCCMDLNVASLIKEELDSEGLEPCLKRWRNVVQEHVTLSPYAQSQVELLMNHFKSGIHFDLLAQQWLLDAINRLQPSADKLDQNIDPNRKKEVLAKLESSWASTKSELKHHLAAVRDNFLSAHKIANGRASPVHFWLLGLLMYLLCACMPWVIVAEYGTFCLLPSLLLAYIFFGARQIGADFWEPFGMDAQGLVDVDLQLTCATTCAALDQTVAFFSAMGELQVNHNQHHLNPDSEDHHVLMRIRRTSLQLNASRSFS